MAKAFNYKGTSIPVASYKGELFFHLKNTSEALGYKGTLPAPEGTAFIEIGRDSYLSLSDLRVVCGSATGERRDAGAAFLQRVADSYGVEVTSSNILLDLDETTTAWARARANIKAAKNLLREASSEEIRLWEQLEEERRNG
jgi:hypothetical protein